MKDSICKNCGEKIRYATSPIDDFWYHLHNERMYCYKNPWTERLSIDETVLFAEPITKHQFKIIGVEPYIYPGWTIMPTRFIVLHCGRCGQVWRIEHDWFWFNPRIRKTAIEPHRLNCNGSDEKGYLRDRTADAKAPST